MFNRNPENSEGLHPVGRNEGLSEKTLTPMGAMDRVSLNDRSSVLCLVSGGMDSMVLLECAHRLQRQQNFELEVIHFNYHLRGSESDEDEAFVREECRRRHVSFLGIPAPLEKGPGIQARARALRYDYIRSLKAEKRWTHVLTGHQADDQAETILMRLERGAMVRGLGGMDPESELAPGLLLLRPFLDICREDIHRFAQEEGILYREDSSNATSLYFRNRIRHGILKTLKERDPSILVKLAESARQLRSFSQTEEAQARSFIGKFKGNEIIEARIPLDAYWKEPVGVRFRIIEALLQKAGFKQQVTGRHHAEAENLFRVGGKVERSYGSAWLCVETDGFKVIPENLRGKQGPSDWEMSIEGPGRYWIAPLRQYLVLTKRKVGIEDFLKETVSREVVWGARSLILNEKSLTFPVVVRFRRPGDRFRPLGLGGSKKLKDYLIDRKIPPTVRDQLLLLTSKDRIFCVVGEALDERVRVLPEDPVAYEVRLVKE